MSGPTDFGSFLKTLGKGKMDAAVEKRVAKSVQKAASTIAKRAESVGQKRVADAVEVFSEDSLEAIKNVQVPAKAVMKQVNLFRENAAEFTSSRLAGPSEQAMQDGLTPAIRASAEISRVPAFTSEGLTFFGVIGKVIEWTALPGLALATFFQAWNYKDHKGQQRLIDEAIGSANSGLKKVFMNRDIWVEKFGKWYGGPKKTGDQYRRGEITDIKLQHNTDHKDKLTLFNTIFTARFLINKGEYVTEDFNNLTDISLTKPIDFLEEDSYFLDFLINDRGKQDPLVKLFNNYGQPKNNFFNRNPTWIEPAVHDFYLLEDGTTGEITDRTQRQNLWEYTIKLTEIVNGQPHFKKLQAMKFGPDLKQLISQEDYFNSFPEKDIGKYVAVTLDGKVYGGLIKNKERRADLNNYILTYHVEFQIFDFLHNNWFKYEEKIPYNYVSSNSALNPSNKISKSEQDEIGLQLSIIQNPWRHYRSSTVTTLPPYETHWHAFIPYVRELFKDELRKLKTVTFWGPAIQPELTIEGHFGKLEINFKLGSFLFTPPDEWTQVEILNATKEVDPNITWSVDAVLIWMDLTHKYWQADIKTNRRRIFWEPIMSPTPQARIDTQLTEAETKHHLDGLSEQQKHDVLDGITLAVGTKMGITAGANTGATIGLAAILAMMGTNDAGQIIPSTLRWIGESWGINSIDMFGQKLNALAAVSWVKSKQESLKKGAASVVAIGTGVLRFGQQIGDNMTLVLIVGAMFMIWTVIPR